MIFKKADRTNGNISGQCEYQNQNKVLWHQDCLAEFISEKKIKLCYINKNKRLLHFVTTSTSKVIVLAKYLWFINETCSKEYLNSDLTFSL